MKRSLPVSVVAAAALLAAVLALTACGGGDKGPNVGQYFRTIETRMEGVDTRRTDIDGQLQKDLSDPTNSARDKFDATTRAIGDRQRNVLGLAANLAATKRPDEVAAQHGAFLSAVQAYGAALSALAAAAGDVQTLGAIDALPQQADVAAGSTVATEACKTLQQAGEGYQLVLNFHCDALDVAAARATPTPSGAGTPKPGFD